MLYPLSYGGVRYSGLVSSISGVSATTLTALSAIGMSQNGL